MDLKELEPILILIGKQEERLAKKIDEVHESVKEAKTELKKLNGTVREHQTIIDKNLPHTIMHCSQHTTIDKIKQALIIDETEKGIKKRHTIERRARFITMITLAGVVVSLVIGLLSLFHTNKIPGLKEEVDMINTPVQTERGIELWPSGVLFDTLKTE
jgi:hypothetical protein